jgi:NitT/TauT family transport system permease protein
LRPMETSATTAPIFGAVAIGLFAAGAIGLLGLVLRPFRLTGASPQ